MRCVCCNSKDIKRKFTKNTFQFYACALYGFQFAHPLLSQESIEKYYNQTRISDDIRDKIESHIKDLKTNPNSPKRDRFDRILSNATGTLEKETLNVLEIGSAYGFSLITAIIWAIMP